MNWRGGAFAAMTACGLFLVPGAAQAQRADENAVASADDAFGINVGSESVGIYSDRDTRGFSPLDAGNARIDGIYYDPVGVLSGRLRESTTIRIGTAAEGFPFAAPTGIVDNKLRPFPPEFGNSVSYQLTAFGGYIFDWDLRLPIVAGKVGLTGGLAAADLRQTGGFRNVGWGYTIRPIFRFGGVEFAPYIAEALFYKHLSSPLVVLAGPDVPDLPKQRRLDLGQDWAKGRDRNDHYGATLKARVTGRLSLRAGLFHSSAPRQRRFSEIFRVTGPGGEARNLLIANPEHALHSTSGEAIFAYRLAGGKIDHRFFAGYRARNRYTESGGADIFDFGNTVFGEANPQPRPDFDFSAIGAQRVRQSSLMLGYIGAIEGVGNVNLGIQKARYRASSRDGSTGIVDRSRASPWLYNATLTASVTPSVSVYAGTQRGLEDRGVAPESAANRAEQLPAVLATQYEGGARWKFSGGQLVFNLFQISKPYFSFDAANRFVELGKERHRGFEVSLSGRFGDRLHLVAGAVVMKPEVTGPAVERGEVGRRPAGTPSINARIDANYRTDIFGGLTPTATLKYIGRRAASSRALPALGDRQVKLPGYATLDLGLRQKVMIGGVPASFRAVVENVFDQKAWKVVAADTLLPDERRRFTLHLAADF